MSAGCSHARGEDASFTDIKIKPQEEMRLGGVNDVIHRKLRLSFF